MWNNFGLIPIVSFLKLIWARVIKELMCPCIIYQGGSNGSILFYKRKQLSISFKGHHQTHPLVRSWTTLGRHLIKLYVLRTYV